MLEGLLVKVKGGFYFVMVPDGGVLRCRARGRLKDGEVHLLVGDRVEISRGNVEDGVVERILPRKNSLTRPPIANVDQAVLVMTLREPPLDLQLIHRIIAAAALAELSIVLCFNKMDLVTLAEEKACVKKYAEAFKGCGYKIVYTSSLTGEGLEVLRELITGKVSVLAGPSGTGKSTLLNKLKPGLILRSAALSLKLQRGRHTTRHVELITLSDDTLVADTPGFQRLDLMRISPRSLASLFPEIHLREGGCRFNSCLHHHEPACAVKEAVQQEEIVTWRYDQYLALLEEAVRQDKT
ncbi:MAG TPA: ribosome small subunit-dependent GTPase A [Firmicutes bacterium]|nr:ribosome small subunit-dependent GTPase A [Bacillota bacterium]